MSLPDGYIQGELFPDMVEKSKTLEDYYMMLEKLEPDDVELSETEREQLQCNEYISWDEFKKECGIMKIPFTKLRPNAFKPVYKTPGAAGFDLATAEPIIIHPGEKLQIPTGLAFEIPEGYEMQIRPRSGISWNTDLKISNSPGTIDSDYRGEVMIIMEHTGKDKVYTFGIGDRVAQGVIAPVIRAEFVETLDLSDSIRGQGGFGSTGK